MTIRLNGLLRFVKQQLSAVGSRGAERRQHERVVSQAVERVVDQVNPRLRAVSRYRKRLFPVVEGAMEHATGLAQRVPGPIRLDRRTWAEDPIVNALFGNADRMRWVLTGPEVRRYVKNHPLGGDCSAVLAAMPELKKQLGMELMGEAVQRDVRQTTMSFANHQVGLVGENEHEVRRALADAALDLLVALATDDITEQESRITELDDRLRITRLKRKLEENRSRGAAFILDGSEEHEKAVQSLDARIAELESDLAGAKKGLESLDDHLQRLVDQLETPDKLLGIDEAKVRLDRMNIVRTNGDAGAELSFTRVRRGEQLARVVTLISFPRSELLEESERLREVERYLA
jgi:hypothetical protein